MKSPQSSGSPISTVSEYALILGAGATAAMSIAAQQVAVATLPVTTLVALGLFNRYRLDQSLQSSQPEGPTAEESTARGGEQARPTALPRPETRSPRPEVAPPAMAAVRFSSQPAYLHGSLANKLQVKADFAAVQRASLQSVGTRLQQLRQEKGLSLEAIYQQTFIQTYSLRAIETGDLKQLPEPFYIRAFIQKYASALGLDGAALAAEFPLG
jgi:hypothetical protein